MNLIKLPYFGLGTIFLAVIMLSSGYLLNAQGLDTLTAELTNAATGETKADWIKGIVSWAGGYLAVYYASEVALGGLVALANNWLVAKWDWFKNANDLVRQVSTWLLPFALCMIGWAGQWGFLAGVTAWAAILAAYRIGSQGNSIFKTFKSVSEILKKRKAAKI